MLFQRMNLLLTLAPLIVTKDPKILLVVWDTISVLLPLTLGVRLITAYSCFLFLQDFCLLKLKKYVSLYILGLMIQRTGRTRL